MAEWSKVLQFGVQLVLMVVGSNPIPRLLFSKTHFLQFSRKKTGEYDFIVHCNALYTETITMYSYRTWS